MCNYTRHLSIYIDTENYSDTVVHCPLCWLLLLKLKLLLWLRVILGSPSSLWAMHTQHTPTDPHVPIYRGIATGKGPHESAGTHNAGIWTWGTVLNLRDVIPSHPPPPVQLLAQLGLHPRLPSLSDKLISFKGCRRQGQFTYIQLDRRARRKQDQWPAWIHSHAKTRENETLKVSFSFCHTDFSTNFLFFYISCFVVLTSHCIVLRICTVSSLNPVLFGDELQCLFFSIEDVCLYTQ